MTVRLNPLLLLPTLGFLLSQSAVTANPVPPAWTLVQNGTTGVVAIELSVISPTLGIILDRAVNNPLMINNHSAWGALWDFRTNTARALDLQSNMFCGAGGFLSNGTLAIVAGHPVDVFNPPGPITPPHEDGRMGVRMFEPCNAVDGIGCEVYDDPEVLHLAVTRWYPTAIRIFDGSLMVIGGNEFYTFYNTPARAVNSFEFVPAKDGGVPRASPFLKRTMPINMFPRAFPLPNGKILIVANNQTILYDSENDSEEVLPEIPNGVRVTHPFDGTATLLPLSPPNYTPEVLVCGGSNTTDSHTEIGLLSKQDPASDQCSRLVVPPEGIRRGWQVERMLEGRMMPEMVLLPNGQVMIVNGGQTGYPALGGVQGAIKDGSNADHPAFTPALYTPDAPRGKRFSNKGLPTSDIPRLYHSTATLTPMGNIMLAGNNPHSWIVNDTEYPSEYRVEYLNPPYMSEQRPVLGALPARIDYNTEITIPVTIPKHLGVRNLKLALMDLGFSTHAWHSNSHLVWMVAKVAADRKTLTFTTPPNNRVYPPGPAYVFLTVDDVTSEGAHTLLGNGLPPPVGDQGVPL